MEHFESAPISRLKNILNKHPELERIYSSSIHAKPEEFLENSHDALSRLAYAIEESLPGVQDGYVRLWRGNRPNEVGHNPSYTNSLEGIALPFLSGYGGVLSYVDVPEKDLSLYESKGAAAPGAEFMLTPEIVSHATLVGFSEEEANAIKKNAQPEDTSTITGNGWLTV